ncbi:hypothetical protein Ahy_B10g104413 [Arachis hypogaea]|uniref:HTH myb-type domain-containing protein n=1 Tax=Arachis hypogaea TaxID=3818 RepID=A0A444X5D7_ARAHY|nr:hypothetical protein Ahy_B10g104413 [Arachis hypogaea]
MEKPLIRIGRPPCCDKTNVKRGLNRCGKSCRPRWTNYLRPDLKHDNFTPQEEELIINLHAPIRSRLQLYQK